MDGNTCSVLQRVCALSTCPFLPHAGGDLCVSLSSSVHLYAARKCSPAPPLSHTLSLTLSVSLSSPELCCPRSLSVSLCLLTLVSGLWALSHAHARARARARAHTHTHTHTHWPDTRTLPRGLALSQKFYRCGDRSLGFRVSGFALSQKFYHAESMPKAWITGALIH
jgi:hypothetical protein